MPDDISNMPSRPSPDALLENARREARGRLKIFLGAAPGVGKTAIAEGFAQRIVAGDVPPPLRGVKVCALDIGLMQAGASMKGEFEQRLRSVIDEVQSSPTPVILFIDEAHTLIGAGGAAGTGDAANLLKPGGVLVYSTCSLEPEEGEKQIESLLASRADLSRDPVRPGGVDAGLEEDDPGAGRVDPPEAVLEGPPRQLGDLPGQLVQPALEPRALLGGVERPGGDFARPQPVDQRLEPLGRPAKGHGRHDLPGGGHA